MATPRMILSQLFLLLLLMCAVLVSRMQAQDEVLTNAAIIELTTLGFSDELIIEKIQHAGCEFDTSLPGLKRLKEAGVSDAVIKAMVNAQSAAVKEAEETQESDLTNPLAPQEPGIYYWTAKPGKGKLVQLEPTVYSQGKTGGWLESQLTYGLAKTKVKAVVPRPRARLRVSEARPVFYFYFEQKGPGLSYAHSFIDGAVSPNEFVLVKMAEKRDSREVTISESNILGTASGTRSADTKDFDFEKLRPGIYRVVITSPLEPGEYCFFYAGATRSERLFDFGSGSYTEAQITRTATETALRPASRKTKQPEAAESDWNDEFALSSFPREEKPMSAKVIDVKKNYLIIELAKGHTLRSGNEVKISWEARGAKLENPGTPAQVVEIDSRYAILKMKTSTSFAVGDKLVVMAME